MQKNSFHKQELSIPDLDSLSELLGFPLYQIREVSESASKFYVPGKNIIKSDGSTRETIKAIEPLASIQSAIREKILNSITFPHYLQGSIKDQNDPRDYIKDTEMHSGVGFIRTIDIERYFPNINPLNIYAIWSVCFGFPSNVSECLTKLTTVNNELPTGAVTSSDLSNLVFFNSEPTLVKSLNELGFTYSRYIDDITISSNKNITPAMLGEALVLISRMLREKGLKINRRKSRKFEKDFKNRKIQVHGLNLKKDNPTIGKKYRSQFRSELHKLECEIETNIDIHALKDKFQRLSGKFAHIQRLHPQFQDKYGNRMQALRNFLFK